MTTINEALLPAEMLAPGNVGQLWRVAEGMLCPSCREPAGLYRYVARAGTASDDWITTSACVACKRTTEAHQTTRAQVRAYGQYRGFERVTG
jgi:hypothetical protein